MNFYKVFFNLIIVFFFSISFHAQNSLIFKDGQTVCFIGNSITQAGTYHLLLQTYYATHFPENKINFISCGVSGDNAPGMVDRFEKDILIHKPDYAFVMTGMNDMYAELYAPGIKVDSLLLVKREDALKTYREQTVKLTELLVSNNVKPILMTPSIYDETAIIKAPSYFGKNDALEKCAQHIKFLGKKYNAPVIDLNSYMLNINNKEQKKEASFTIVGQDRVHPKETGHFIMAYKIINTLFPENDVLNVSINAKNKRITALENCSIEFINENNGFRFSVRNSFLPFPLTNEFKEAQKFVPFVKEYNQEILKISGLKKGSYIFKIDKKVVDTLSSKALKKGVNLALNVLTPQYQQAKNVFNLCKQYHKIQSKLRIIALIQYRNLKDFKGPETIVAQKKFLAAQVEDSRGKSWYEYSKMTCKKYFEILPFEKELWQELEQIRSEIYTRNIPHKHIYSFEKL